VFKPPVYEFRLTLAFNYNRVDTDDVRALHHRSALRHRRATTASSASRKCSTTIHMRDVSTRYDFDSIRVGIQPFSTDFRGFLFQDLQFGVRLFGNRDNNFWQYNLAWFRRVEKDTNSGLNDVFEGLRDDDIFIANVLSPGLFPSSASSQQATIVHNRNREDELLLRQTTASSRARRAWAANGVRRTYDVDLPRPQRRRPHRRLQPDDSRPTYALGNNERTPSWRDSRHPRRLLRRGTLARLRLDPPAAVAGLGQRRRQPVRRRSAPASTRSSRTRSLRRRRHQLLDPPEHPADRRRRREPGGPQLACCRSLRSSKEQGQSQLRQPGPAPDRRIGADFDLTPQSRLSVNVNQLWFDDTEMLEVARNQGPDRPRDRAPTCPLHGSGVHTRPRTW
jgi:hypothetical protein